MIGMTTEQMLLTLGVTQQQYSDLVQKWLDDFAKTKMYDNANSCITYVNSTVPHYKAEAERMSLIRDLWWDKATEIMNECEAGNRPIPTEQELWQELNEVIPLSWE